VTTVANGIFGRRIAETPIAVLDFETTGLSAGYDRVVEVSVVRIEPGSQPRLVLDTLVNPNRPMAATHIHGITDRDVANAPSFEHIAGDLLRAISDSVVAAHNVYFDMGFLRYELGRLSEFGEIPHVCTRYTRPIIGLAACGLDEACRADQIGYTPTHSSRTDATAAARLWIKYCEAFLDRRITTFRNLTSQGKRYKFFTSFGCDTIRHRSSPPAPGIGLKPRR
jgi:DNA polymerase-3 subunit epsilon